MEEHTAVRDNAGTSRYLISRSELPAFEEQKTNPLLGSLHDKPCSIDTFTRLSPKFGKCELLNGVRRYRPMNVRSHDCRRQLMQFYGEKIAFKSSMTFLLPTE